MEKDRTGGVYRCFRCGETMNQCAHCGDKWDVCEICGRMFALSDPATFEYPNGKSLCRECHAEAHFPHPAPKTRMPILP